MVLSRLLKVPLLPWHLWPGWRRWHPRIGGEPRQRLATQRCHTASAGCRGAGHRRRLQKAKQKSSATALGRSHAAGFVGRKIPERARPGMLLQGAQGGLLGQAEPLGTGGGGHACGQVWQGRRGWCFVTSLTRPSLGAQSPGACSRPGEQEGPRCRWQGGAASNAGRGLAASLQRRVEGSSVGGSGIV